MLTARLSHQWLMFDSQASGVGAGDLGFSKQVILPGLHMRMHPEDFFGWRLWEGRFVWCASSAESGTE